MQSNFYLFIFEIGRFLLVVYTLLCLPILFTAILAIGIAVLSPLDVGLNVVVEYIGWFPTAIIFLFLTLFTAKLHQKIHNQLLEKVFGYLAILCFIIFVIATVSAVFEVL